MALRKVIRVVYSILGLVYVFIGFAAIAGAAGWLPEAFVLQRGRLMFAGLPGHRIR